MSGFDRIGRSYYGVLFALLGSCFSTTAYSEQINEPISVNSELMPVYLHYTLANMCLGVSYDQVEIESLHLEVKRLSDSSSLTQASKDAVWKDIKGSEGLFKKELTVEKCFAYKSEAQNLMPKAFGSDNPF